jgi:hypothetical protein
MQFEWISNYQNVPHVFVNNPADMLAIAKTPRSDNRGPGFDMLDPVTGVALGVDVQPLPGVWPPVVPSRDQWTIYNVLLGGRSIADWFARVDETGVDPTKRWPVIGTETPPYIPPLGGGGPNPGDPNDPTNPVNYRGAPAPNFLLLGLLALVLLSSRKSS